MKIYEDDIVDIKLDNDKHTLIIPKKHYTNIYNIAVAVLSHIYMASKK